MFERILLPLDGSELSEMSLPYGEELAEKFGSEVILYHVHGQEHLHLKHMHQMYLDRLAEAVERNIKKNQPNGNKVKVTTKIDVGEPIENICNLVNKNKVDLIIMSFVSVSGLKLDKILGSVTDYVCRRVRIPVMLIRPQRAKSNIKGGQLINNILIPLDGSDLSKLALPIGEELATKFKASITLFQMATRITLLDEVIEGSPYDIYAAKFNEGEKKRVSAEMTELEHELKNRNLNINNIVTSNFDAAYEIIKVCKKAGIDMVVMSTHGRSGLGRWVFGSIANKILHHGETPLLLVHARAG